MVFKNGLINIQAAADNGVFGIPGFELSVRISLQKADNSGIFEEF